MSEVEPIADHRGKFDWLEIPPTASVTAVQEAYHQVARTRHPDLFHHRIDAVLMDRLVRMYARVTAAYADLRDPDDCAAYLRALKGPRPRTPTPPPMDGVPPRRPSRSSSMPPPQQAAPSRPVTMPPPGQTSVQTSAQTSGQTSGQSPVQPSAQRAQRTTTVPPPRGAEASGRLEPAQEMNPRALAFYRRAEGAMRTGDRAAAVLHLKMAIAADPRSTFLRAALAEVARR